MITKPVIAIAWLIYAKNWPDNNYRLYISKKPINQFIGFFIKNGGYNPMRQQQQPEKFIFLCRSFFKYARMAKLVNVAVSEAVGVKSLRVRVSLRAHSTQVVSAEIIFS